MKKFKHEVLVNKVLDSTKDSYSEAKKRIQELAIEGKKNLAMHSIEIK